MRFLRIVLLILFFFVGLILTGCGSDEEEEGLSNTKFIELSTILQMGGYHMVEQGAAKAFKFNNDEINERFDIEVELYQLLTGDKDGSEDVYMIVFWEIEDAIIYEDAVLANPGVEERLFHREEHIVILTANEEAMALFE